MQSNLQPTNQPALNGANHLSYYDPSAPYRAMMLPPAPTNTNATTTNQYYSNSIPTQNISHMNSDPMNPIVTRIPKYYYPRYDGYDGAYDDHGTLGMRETYPNVQPPVNQQLPSSQQIVPNEYVPYNQPAPLTTDPYASGGYYPYGTSYLIPLPTNMPSGIPSPYLQEQQPQADAALSHKKDADLSRLEVYHFTPKQNTSLSMGANAPPPVIQYHVYPPAPVSQPPAMLSQQQQPSYLSEHFQSQLAHQETKARSSQTDQPNTKNRAVSPIHFSNTIPMHNDDGYSRVIHQQEVHTDRHNIRTARINRQFYGNTSSPALPDCRCLDCQQERKEATNSNQFVSFFHSTAKRKENMRSPFIVVLLVGLAASSYAYHLSDVHKRSLEEEPRIFQLLEDLYSQVLYKPLNHIVTNVALLGAQFLAGISQNGIPAPGGRTLHLSEAQLRGFWNDLWNHSIRPPIENAIQTVSLLGAQLLAGIGTNGVNLSIGKRDVTEVDPRFINALTEAAESIFTNVIQKPLQDALSTGALMLAQVLAGVGTNGIDLSALFGKRDVTEVDARFINALTEAAESIFTNVIQKPLQDALSTGALMLAQVLAGVGTNGIDLSALFGKRDLSELAGRQEELRGFFDTLGQSLLSGLQSVWTNVIQGPVEQAIQTTALLGAQVLAGLGTNGVNIGKRELEAEPRGEIIDNLLNHASGLFTTQVKPVIESALNAAALHLAGVLANISQNGFGRR
ncbi:unnamed protein product [Rotaria socialis]|uniref:Uncharacterized protein n=2 Tax=Rotaria socialis TaxID=392032 RepID=A0A818DP28_9BILA|nr:unnamed protein product [Rotaria socialis]